jgi:5-methylcytosine-specific restriction protein A
MPRANQWRVCSENGCPNLVQGSTRCDEHPARNPDTRRPSASARGYDARWRAERAAFLREFPDCDVSGCSRKATDVDHIDNLGPLGPRGYDWSNLRPLCHQHHSAKTAATTHAARNTISHTP